MATIFAEEFDGGTAGAAVTTANTGFNIVGADSITFVSNAIGSGKFGIDPFGVSPFGGGAGLAAQVAATGTVRDMRVNQGTPRGLLFRRFYLYLPSLPSATMGFASVRGGGALRGELRVRNDGSLLVLNGGTNVFTSPAGTVPADTWVRVEWRLDLPASVQQVRLYHGANLYGSTTNYDTGPRTYTSGSIDQTVVGVLTAMTATALFDSVVEDDSKWVGATVDSPAAVRVELFGENTLQVSLSSVSNAVTVNLSGSGALSAALYAVPVLPPSEQPFARRWVMFARGVDYAPTVELPILSAQMVVRHMGVGKAVVRTSYTEERWSELGPGKGVTLWRDDRQEFTGLVAKRDLTWDAESGRVVIQADCEGDEAHFADRLVFPDPLRAAADQTVNDYWTFTGVASSAMLRLISDQAGPTCRADRQVTGLVLGSDPGRGTNRKWQALFNNDESMLGTLAAISVSSGANLGLRMESTPGRLSASITAPRDLSSSAVFSADLSNLVGFTYSEAAPTVTHALAAGSGDLKARARRLVATTSPSSLQWRRQRWRYVDVRDMGLVTDLDLAAADELADGGPTVEVSVTLKDSDAATYGTDWGLGDRITIYVGLPGQTKPAVVNDVVREVFLDVDPSGAETIRPAVGTTDAKAVPTSPQQRQMAAIGAQLSNLIARK